MAWRRGGIASRRTGSCIHSRIEGGNMIAHLVAAALLAQAGGEIKVGGIFDLTGVTSDVGKSFAQGVRDGVKWTNENGGINGKQIKLVDVDYGYKMPEAGAAYKRLT